MVANRTGAVRGGRRWFLAMGGGATAAAALAATGCQGGTTKPRPTSTAERSTAPATQLTSSGTPTNAGTATTTLRYTGFVSGDGVYDPHKTQAGPFYGQQALVYSRLLAYSSQVDGTIAADLAVSLPEQPDSLTYLFRLNQNARWHNQPPVNGRPVTSEDVKFSIVRQQSGDTSFVRKAQWTNIESIETPSPDRVVVKLKTPLATGANLFADVNSFIVSPEMEKAGFTADRQVGSGPFRWVEWSEGKFATVSRNPGWHGGNSRPYLDGITLRQAQNASEIEAGLRTKALDVAFVGRKTANQLRAAKPELQERAQTLAQFYGIRFFLPQFPFNDVRFRSAVSYALDRRAMISRFFADSGEVNPWVSTAIRRWSLPQAELATIAGYRPGTGGRAEDVKDARALLSAVKADKTLPSELPLFVVDAAEKAIGMGTTIRDQLQETLDLNVKVFPIPIGELASRVFSQNGPWAAAPDIGWVDLDDWLYPYFHSSGTNNSFALKDGAMDALIEAQRIELNEARRREIGFEIQRKLLALNAGINLVSETVVGINWPYVKGFPFDAADGYQHRLADCRLDPADPTFKGR